MSDLSDLYQEVILDHNRRPRNFRVLDAATHQAEGYNPLCGDRFELYLTIDGGVITDVGFQGSGCAISKASASMMTDCLKGCPVADACALFERFHSMVTTPPDVRGRRSRQAVRSGGCTGVPRAREMCQPGVAHVQGGAQSGAAGDYRVGRVKQRIGR